MRRLKFKYQSGDKTKSDIEIKDQSVIDFLEEERKRKEKEYADSLNVSDDAWGTPPITEKDTRTDEEYFYDTTIDRRIPSDGPIQAKKIIGEKSPKLKLNEDYYRNKDNYTGDVTNQFSNIKEEALPDTSSNYQPELKYNSYYSEGEHEEEILPYINELEQKELDSYDPKVEEYIAESLSKLGFNSKDLGERARYTRDELYNNIKPEIIELLESKGLKLDKVNWERVRGFSDKKFNKRIDKVVKTANTNPLLKQASPRMIENKLIGILEKGKFKDPYKDLDEEQIKIAEGLNGKIKEDLRQDIIKDMKRGKTKQELFDKYKKDIPSNIIFPVSEAQSYKKGRRLKFRSFKDKNI